MKGTTHLLSGILIGLLLPSEYRLLTLSLATIGALLPDIDTTSKISRQTIKIPFLQHRGITHAIWTPIGLWVASYQIPEITFLTTPLSIGILTHILLDTLTPAGTHPFYPLRMIHLRGNIQSGGLKEKIITLLITATILLIIAKNIV